MPLVESVVRNYAKLVIGCWTGRSRLSVHEAADIAGNRSNFLRVTPGIRPAGPQ